ncbi:MAG: TonB-dependent receptor, partial [Acidobacteriota bacterium]|nr:TonB-dependent receptor [Acidobacteriota bacterium]
MRSNKPVTLILMMLALVVWASPSFAQSDRGTLTGTITDPNGAVVANAKVTLTNLDTGGVRETTTSDEGSFTFPELPADPYRLTVEATGFKTATIEDIKIAVQVTRSADVTLEVGGAGETITVTADTSVLQTESPVQQTNVTERQVKELPLLTGIDTSGRTPLSFIFLDSSVVDASGSSQGASANRFKVNGGQALGTEILIDGAATRRAQNGTFFGEVSPSPNAFQEFTLSTSSFSAEFGNSSGGIVNFTIKSGSNEFHGETYLLFTDESLNANGFNRNAQGFEKRAPEQKKDFGFNVGGPIYLPRFGEGGPAYLSGKNRAFFFFNYNGFRFDQTENVFISVPTARMRQGDFGELLTDPYVLQFFGGPVRIYDPTAPPGPNRPVIPNNDVRTYRNAAGQLVIDPIGFNILQFFPSPTRPGVYRNFLATSTKPEETNEFTGKIDFIASDTQRLAFSYSYRRRFSLAGQGDNGGFLRFPGEVPATNVWEQPFRSHFARLSHDYTITPTLLNHFNAGFTRYAVANRNLTQDEIDPVSLGFSPSATQRRAFPIAGFPGYGNVITSPDPRSYQSIGSTFFSDILGDNAVQFTDFVTYVRGRQTMKFGADIRTQQFNVTQLIHPGGEFNFRNNQTSRDNENSGGWPIASLITGATEFSFNSVQTIAPAYRQFSQSYFFTDDIKVTPKLTLNVGVRYDLPGLRREAGNRFRTFDPNVINPVVGRRGALVSANATGALQAEFETLAKPDRSNIGPRLGFAYALNNRTVVRGGAGLYYAPVLYGFGGMNNLTEGTIGYNTLGGPNINFGAEARPENFLRNYRPIPPIAPFGQFIGSDVDFFQRDFKTGRTLQYSLDIQRELPYNFALQISYIGNRGTRLRSDFNRINGLPLDTLKLGNAILFKPLADVTATERAYASSVGITLPASPGTVFPGFNGSVADSLRPFPQYRFIRNQLESDGRSWYNALQVKLDRRFAQGIQFGLSYT